MFELLDLRTGVIIAEFYTQKAAMLACNVLTYVFGAHYAVRPTFTENHELNGENS